MQKYRANYPTKYHKNGSNHKSNITIYNLDMQFLESCSS